MTVFQEESVLQRLRKKIFVLKAFDTFLQFAVVVTILLKSNALLLLRREAATGNVPAFLEHWVIIGSALAEFTLGSVLAWCGRGKRHLMLSASLGAAALFGLLVLVVPFRDPATPAVELCNGDPISAYYSEIIHYEGHDLLSTDHLSSYRLSMLIITVITSSLAMISFFAHGITYLDDHEPQNGPYVYGFLISIRLTLGITGENLLKPSSLTDAWWNAQFSLSMLVLLFAVLFIFFPKTMPNWKPVDVTDDTGYFRSLQRMLSNKMLLIQMVALSLLNISLFCFIPYDGAYVEARFHIESLWTDPRTSRAMSDIFRALVVIFLVMIFRVRFSDRRSDGVKANTAARVGGVVAIFVAIFFAVIAMLSCGTGDVAGLESGSWERPQCSSDCGCDSGKYGFTPVCIIDTDVTHFSPCNAGCYEYEDLNGLTLFSNCTCGTEERIARGSCTLPSCQSVFGTYQIIYTITVAVSAAAMMMQGMVVLRAVERWDKPIAQGFTICMISLITYVPGHIIYMIISYVTCAYPGEDGATCIFHGSNLWWMPLISALLALCSAIASFIASKVQQDSGKPTVIDNRTNGSTVVGLESRDDRYSSML